MSRRKPTSTSAAEPASRRKYPEESKEKQELLAKLEQANAPIHLPSPPTYNLQHRADTEEAYRLANEAMTWVDKYDTVIEYVQKHESNMKNKKVLQDAIDCYKKQLDRERKLWLEYAEKQVKRHRSLSASAQGGACTRRSQSRSRSRSRSRTRRKIAFG